MLALYRCGRQADALEAFHAARARFVEELGIEPGQPLRELHEDVLRHAELARTLRLGQRRPAPLAERTVAGAAEPHDRPRARARRRSASGCGRARAAAHAHRPGRGRQDAARAGGRPRGRARTSPTARTSSRSPPCSDPRTFPRRSSRRSGSIVLSGESPTRPLERFLAAKHLLLVVDNFEHVLAAAPFIGGLLEACPALTVLATSREPLALHAEERYPVSPLALPERATLDDPQALAGVDAVALFCERARAHDPDFDLGDANAAAVAEICRRLDGLPLAIELAAARCGLLSAGEIAERLDTALGALGAGARDAPARQQTLRATIDWSHELLRRRREAVLRALRGVRRRRDRRGGRDDHRARASTRSTAWSPRACSCAASTPHAPTRLGMLETIRAYAARALRAPTPTPKPCASTTTATTSRSPSATEPNARSGAPAPGSTSPGWTPRSTTSTRRSAGRSRQPSAELALAMAAALGCYWVMRNRYADAVDWVDQALNLPGADAHPALRVRALRTKARCLWPRGARSRATRGRWPRRRPSPDGSAIP